MDAADDGSQLPADVEESLCRDDVAFAVVFGSRTGDDGRAASDIDVAIKFSERLSPDERFRKQCFLSGDLQRPDAPFVDVSDIERLPLDVAHDAITGDFLCGDRQAFETFRTSLEREFAEQQEDIKRRHRDTIDRIAEDGLHG